MNSNAGTSLSFTHSGSYTLKATSGNATVTVQLNVIPTLSSISMQDSNKASLRSGAALQLANSRTRLHAVGLDQFGIPLKTQPQLNWSFPTKPNGSNPTVQTSSNRADIQLDRVGSYVVQASSGNIRSQVNVSQGVTLSRIELVDTSGDVLTSNALTTTTTRTQQFTVRGFDQFGQPIAALPSLTWTAMKAPTGGRATGTLARSNATITFTAPGTYSLKVAGGNASTSFQVNVVRTFSTLEAINAANTSINPRVPLVTNGTSISVSLRGVDPFGRAFTEAPNANWSVVSGPNGNSTQFSTSRGITTVNFNRAATYVLRATAGNSSFTFTVAVSQRVASLSLTPGTASLDAGGRLQFQATGLDQFGNAITNLGTVAWSATGGTISSSGMFQAGSQSGAFQVTARSGQISASVSGTIASAGAHSALTNSSLRSLVSSLHADNSITRLEMIQILRSVGNDGVVGSDELTDLRLLVSSNSGFLMPAYVRELAKDVVNSNPANARFRGQTAGNLSAGSSANLLNNLIDKWFLGADLPIITGGGITYQTANGVLFSGSPSRNDARQGYLGDCYFIASVTSIADQTPAAIQNMFLDNGDGTFTVRFFGPTATDYVTVSETSIGNWTTVVMTPIHFEIVETNYLESYLNADTVEDDTDDYVESNDSMGLHSWTTPDQNQSGVLQLRELVAEVSQDEAERVRTSDEIANDLAFSFEHIEDLLLS